MISYYKSEKIFEQAFQFSAIGLVIVDLDGRCLVVNEALCEMLGYQHTELTDMAYLDITHPKDIELVVKTRELVLEENTFYQLEKRFVKKDRSTIWGLVNLSIVRDDSAHPVYFIIQIQDITVRKETERQLKVNKERWKKIIETVPGGIMMIDLNGEITFANETAERILRYRKEDIIFKKYNAPQWKNERLDGSVLPDGELPFSIVMRTKQPVYNVVHAMKGKDGTHIIISVNATPIHDEDGEMSNVLFSISDITSQKLVEQQLLEANLIFRRQSQLDGLTGVANRRYFDEYLEEVWKKGEREHKPLSVILFDLDYFKLFNDTYGHQCGDDCLRDVAAAVNEIVKKKGYLLARYGGEEFAIILANTNCIEANRVANEIKTVVEQLQILHESSEMHRHVTVSVGVATTIPVVTTTADELINQADRALYQAKNNGRNVVKAFREGA